MEARISAVQQVLLLLLVASLALGVLARPHPDNHRFTGALRELSAFRASFDRSAAEGLLRAEAEAQHLIPLAALQAAVAGPSVPPLQLAPDAPPLRPITGLRLATLADVYAHGQANSKVTIGTPDLSALASSIAWRLARAPQSGPFQLRSVELATAQVGPEDLKLEHDVARLRLAIADAQADVDAATKRLDTENRIYDARRAMHASWKMVLKSIDAQKLATSTLEEKQRVLSETQRSYEQGAKRAEEKRAPSQPATLPEQALAKVFVQGASGSVVHEIPVALSLRAVPVPPLPGAKFEATRAAELWDEVKAADAEHAIGAVRAHFNWHNRRIDVAGLALSGALVLQLAPCLLPLLLVLLLARVRRVGKSYSPFSTKVPETLPRVGFRSRFFDAIVVAALPFLTALSAAASLYLIGQVPVLPVVTALLSLMLGVSAFARLGELQELIQSVVHSHSYPPPQRG